LLLKAVERPFILGHNEPSRDAVIEETDEFESSEFEDVELRWGGTRKAFTLSREALFADGFPSTTLSDFSFFSDLSTAALSLLYAKVAAGFRGLGGFIGPLTEDGDGEGL